jgi:hypothetical protein
MNANKKIAPWTSPGGESMPSIYPHAEYVNLILASGHCQRFGPKFDAAAKKIADARLDAKLGKVDCTIHGNFCAEKGIRAYPTMKIYKQGEELYHEYTGPRRVAA